MRQPVGADPVGADPGCADPGCADLPRAMGFQGAGFLLAAGIVALAIPVGLAAETAAGEAGDTPTSAMRIVAGDGQAGFADGRPGRFNKPIRLAPWTVSDEPAILVADIYNHAIRIVSAGGEVRTLAGRPDAKGHRDGPAAEARFASPHGVAVSPQGRIAVAEAEGHTVRLIVPEAPGSGSYRVSTLAGAPGEEGFADGLAAEARFSSPHAVVWLDEERLLVADIGNARLRLIAGDEVRTVAGTDERGQADGGPGVASFKYPMDLALAADGSVLVADAGNHRVRRRGTGRRVRTVD